jgi:hypothetical protein
MGAVLTVRDRSSQVSINAGDHFRVITGASAHRFLALILASIMSLAACSGPRWTKTAGETTCMEWRDQMTTENRSGLAAAMLEALWNQDGAGAHPSDALAVSFANAIGQVCASYPTTKISSVGSIVYHTSSEFKP